MESIIVANQRVAPVETYPYADGAHCGATPLWPPIAVSQFKHILSRAFPYWD